MPNIYLRLVTRVLLALVLSIHWAPRILAAEAQQLPDSALPEVAESKARRAAEEMLSSDQVFADAPFMTEEAPEDEAYNTPFFIREIRLNGNALLPDDVIQKHFSPHEYSEVTLNDMITLSKKLEEEYRKIGYVAIVYVPPQKLETQVVTLEVVMSRMGQTHLEIEGKRYFHEDLTLSRWQTPAGELLRYDEIRSNLTAMNQNPDRKVQGVLRPGKEQGLTDVYLTEKHQSPVHYGFSLDNQGAKLTGKERPGLTWRHNNLLDADDTFLVGALWGSEVGVFYTNYVLPLMNSGARLAAHFSYSQVAPKKQFEAAKINGTSQTHGLQLRKWLIKDEAMVLDAFIGFDNKKKRTKQLSTIVARDKLNIISAGVDMQRGDESGVWSTKQSLASGLPGESDDRPEDIIFTSRRAGSYFTKYEYTIQRVQKLPLESSGVVNVTGQWTRSKLTTSEQIFFGGADTVRGYPESDYGADVGAYMNLEYWPSYLIPDSWAIPRFNIPVKKITRPFLFVDYAYGRLIDASFTETEHRNLLGIGAGLNFQINEHISTRIALGFPVGDRPITETGSSQVHFKIRGEY